MGARSQFTVFSVLRRRDGVPTLGGMMPRKLTAACLLVLGCSLCRAGWANIYAYTADDGTVALTNVPTDARFTLLVGVPEQAIAPARVHVERSGRSGAAKAHSRVFDYDAVVDEVSRAYGLESALLHAVISVESRYNPKAVSKKGAVGLMQLMPQTAKRYGVADAFDPLQNLYGGAQYLKDLLQMFNNNLSLALAAYNAGEQAVVKHGNRIPPYGETQRYVPLVLDFYRRYKPDALMHDEQK
jgi:soluble lytic murein transglycosylase-like protein